jgi:hypothetical protein
MIAAFYARRSADSRDPHTWVLEALDAKER